MTRRQILMTIAAMASGSALVRARQEKKGDGELTTVTLIIDGMT